MRMDYKLATAALVLCVSLAMPASAGIVYSVNRTVTGGHTVAGTIETDGTIGTILFANLLDWSISVDGRPPATPSSNAQGSGLIVGTNLSATATTLDFNFDGPVGWVLFQSNTVQDFWCVAVSSRCTGIEGESARSTFVGFSGTGRLSGIRTIATTHTSNVPEPSSIGLLAAGLAGLAWRASRARQRG